MDVDGELIKRQNITLQINFHCLVDLQIIFLTPQNPKTVFFSKTNVATPIFYCRNIISIHISIRTENFRRFWPLDKVWENFLCNILLILLDAPKFHGAREKGTENSQNLMKCYVLNVFFWSSGIHKIKMYHLNEWENLGYDQQLIKMG